MTYATRRCADPSCGKEFVTERSTRLYCQPACSQRVRGRKWTRTRRDPVKHRERCRAWRQLQWANQT